MDIKEVNGWMMSALARGYLGTAFWCQRLTDPEDDLVENLDDKYDITDMSEEALAFIAGEAFMIGQKLWTMTGMNNMTGGALESIAGDLAGSACGVGITLREVWPLDEVETRTLQAWYHERWKTRTLELYPGDDGKVYVAGHEKPYSVRIAYTSEGVYKHSVVKTVKSVSGAAGLLEEIRGIEQHFGAVVSGVVIEPILGRDYYEHERRSSWRTPL